MSCPTLGLACVQMLIPISPEYVLFLDFPLYFCFALIYCFHNQSCLCVAFLYMIFYMIFGGFFYVVTLNLSVGVGTSLWVRSLPFSLNFGRFFVLGLYQENFFYKRVSFWLHSFCGLLEGWDPVNRFHHTSWMTVVTPIDRPKWVHIRCVIKVCVLSWLIFWWYGSFSHRTGLDLFLFLVNGLPFLNN